MEKNHQSCIILASFYIAEVSRALAHSFCCQGMVPTLELSRWRKYLRSGIQLLQKESEIYPLERHLFVVWCSGPCIENGIDFWKLTQPYIRAVSTNSVFAFSIFSYCLLILNPIYLILYRFTQVLFEMENINFLGITQHRNMIK